MFAIQANNAKNQAKLGQQQSEDSLDMFFGTFFPNAGPDQGAKMAPEIRRSMDAAVELIMNDEKYDAVVVGKLFNRLGWIYFNQQDYESAFSVFQHSQLRVASEYGENHEVAMTAMDHVGMTLMRQDKYVESEECLLRAWKLQAEELGIQHENTIHSYAKLGDLYQRMGRFDDSIEITKDVLKIRQQPGRNDSAFVLVTMNGLANAYFQKEQPLKAIELLDSVIAVKESENSIDIGLSYNLHKLARAYRQIGDLEKAHQLNDRCLTIRRTELGESSDSVVAARTLEAALMVESGEPKAALPLLKTIWHDIRGTTLHVRKGMVRLELGLCLKELGRNDEALLELVEARNVLEQYLTEKNYYSKVAQTAIDELNQ